jgi:hypothetical protein
MLMLLMFKMMFSSLNSASTVLLSVWLRVSPVTTLTLLGHKTRKPSSAQMTDRDKRYADVKSLRAVRKVPVTRDLTARRTWNGEKYSAECQINLQMLVTIFRCVLQNSRENIPSALSCPSVRPNATTRFSLIGLSFVLRTITRTC